MLIKQALQIAANRNKINQDKHDKLIKRGDTFFAWEATPGEWEVTLVNRFKNEKDAQKLADRVNKLLKQK